MKVPGWIMSSWVEFNVKLQEEKFFFQKDMTKLHPDGVLNFDLFEHVLTENEKEKL